MLQKACPDTSATLLNQVRGPGKLWEPALEERGAPWRESEYSAEPLLLGSKQITAP